MNDQKKITITFDPGFVVLVGGIYKERSLWEDEYEEFEHPFVITHAQCEPCGIMIEWPKTQPENLETVEREILSAFIDTYFFPDES